jgi:hypothetical protein
MYWKTRDPDGLAPFDDRGEAPVAHLDFVQLAALPAKSKSQRRSRHLDVFFTHRGEAVRLVRPHVLFVADADQRQLEQPHDGRQQLVPRETRLGQVLIHARPQRREGLAERGHAVELALVANLAPARVIAVLLASFRIPGASLDVAVGQRTDPDVAPRRWDDERLDSA